MSLRRVLSSLLVLAVLLGGATVINTSGLGVSGGTNSAAESTPRAVTAEVVGVVDGDTVLVRYENGSRDRVRLMGIDTPETGGPAHPEKFDGIPNTSKSRQWLRTWGDRATNATRARLEGRTVRLVLDETLPIRDFHGRLLAYIYVDGTLVNWELVREGYATVFPADFVERDRFTAAENDARQHRRGLWNFTATGDG